MKKNVLLIFSIICITGSLHAQVALLKMVGKNAEKSKMGFGTFWGISIPVNEIGNRSVVIELLDLAYFPPKLEDQGAVLGFLSVKLGYRYIFSYETRTGFYVLPQLGYCRVVMDEGLEGTHSDGIAAALEGGYTVEVGQRGNSLNFGLKYEADMAGKDRSVSSLALRLSFSFNIFGNRNY